MASVAADELPHPRRAEQFMHMYSHGRAVTPRATQTFFAEIADGLPIR